ncbi:helix-turn-helix domain-containing protein [Marinomonas sp. M1K-6]|uniref:Helix-turn-helix domain-containing protein n=1 Tax=Marinomonas profundi TaxID=2726122 RepID=A0A847R954_9GAMM|nr:helix-turn-helix domain-containing protein [Marinomonas profundi]NLQ17474.1 helix-turn-helix domain-containing protein [Marinomonas profundi]UDV01996.1 helix-turn-helix domain-containing protein [Marinomonas profundi]
MKHLNIPHFGLYGESSWINDPEFFHIEDIESRSGDLGWKINPHRHAQLFQILILKAGEVNVQLDAEQYRLRGAWAIIVPAGVVHGFRFAPETDGRVISIAEPLLEDVYKEKSAKFIQPLLSQACYIDFNAHRTVFSELWPLIQQLERESAIIREGRALMSEYLIKAILLLLHRQQANDAVTNTNKTELSQAQQLKELIEKHYREHWTSHQYAEKLNTSISRLNRLSKTAFNQSTLELIHDRVLLEAKRSLIYTARSVEEISYDLGFKDPGYFSRFFKRSTGVPPGKFRALSNQPAI